MPKVAIQATIYRANSTVTVAENASIAIRDATTGALVPLWADSAGTIATVNPTVADAGGFFRVYATTGRVNITATYGVSSQVWNDVNLVLFEDMSLRYPTAWNDIVNGDFKIAQIGTSFAAPSSGAYDLDGWVTGRAGAAIFTIAQVAGSSAGKLARQGTVTTASGVVAAGDFVYGSTRIEGSSIVKYVGNTFTVGFRARFPVTGIHCVSLRNSGNDRSYVAEVNCLVANAWASYSFTVVGGLTTTGTWNYINGVGLRVSLAHLCGTTFQTTSNAWNTGTFYGTVNQVNDCATLSNVWAMEDVTISLGNFVIPSNVSYWKELARCMLQYESSYAFGVVAGTNTAVGAVMLPPYSPSNELSAYKVTFSAPKLTDPTVTLYALDGTLARVDIVDTGLKTTVNTTARNVYRYGFSGWFAIGTANTPSDKRTAFHFTAISRL